MNYERSINISTLKKTYYLTLSLSCLHDITKKIIQTLLKRNNRFSEFPNRGNKATGDSGPKYWETRRTLNSLIPTSLRETRRPGKYPTNCGDKLRNGFVKVIINVLNRLATLTTNFTKLIRYMNSFSLFSYVFFFIV